jgi:putative spermidine/putrescine transport system permease protein
MFVTARHIFTLPRMIFEEIHDNLDPAVAAVSAMMMLVTVAVAGVLLWRDLRGTPAAADKP